MVVLQDKSPKSFGYILWEPRMYKTLCQSIPLMLKFLTELVKSLPCWCQKIIKVIMIHPLGITNIWTEFNDHLSNSCRHNLTKSFAARKPDEITELQHAQSYQHKNIIKTAVLFNSRQVCLITCDPD